MAFDYDACGNRISRNVQFGKISENGRSVENPQGLASIVMDQIGGMKLIIYPNPTKGLFLVELDKEWMGTHLQVVLLTSHGDALTKRSLTVGTEEFDLSNYPAGVYLLQFVVGEESQIWKIVKY